MLRSTILKSEPILSAYRILQYVTLIIIKAKKKLKAGNSSTG